MTENISKDTDPKVYEIGYLLVASLPVEKVSEKVDSLRDVLLKKGAAFIKEEAPELIELAYPMTKKIGATNQRFEKGYFGWMKFELQAVEIESVKKTFETLPEMLRMLLINTVKENTYLGKKAPAYMPKNTDVVDSGITTPEAAIPATIEEMDKSIDEMVKEA